MTDIQVRSRIARQCSAVVVIDHLTTALHDCKRRAFHPSYPQRIFAIEPKFDL